MEKREGGSSGSIDTADIVRELARRAMEKAMEKSVAAQAAIDSAIDAAFVATGAAADFSSERLLEVKEKIELIKSQYVSHEEMAIAKIKEGVLAARSHPGLCLGVATSTGLVLLKGPRQYLIQTLRRTFERSLNAERQFEKGLATFKEEGRAIESQLRNIKRVENEIRDLKEVLHQLPRPQASPFKSQAAKLDSEVKREKKALSAALSKILNYGVPI